MGDAGVVPESVVDQDKPVSSSISSDPKNTEKKKSDVVSTRFNQDGTSLVVSTTNGFRVFDVSSRGELVMIFDIANIPQITHIQRLYNSNLVAFVSALDPEALKIFNMRRNDVICDHRYDGKIRWLSMNRVRIVVAIDEKVHIHKIRNMDTLHTIPSVTSNPKDLFAMATYEQRSYLAFPCEIDKGHICTFDLDSFAEKYRIPAHHAPLQVICFNEHATRLATSSIKGTVIRVFDASLGTKLHEFRRGFWQTVISCLAFTSNGEYLGCTSENETVHVFKILSDVQIESAEEGWLHSVGKLATNATGLISSEVERYINEERSVATFKNPHHMTATKLNIVADAGGTSFYIQICGDNGFVYGFCLETKDSVWSCEIQKAYFLIDAAKKKIRKN